MRPRAEQPVVALILRDLEFGPSTVVELETVLKIRRQNLRRYLSMLHAKRKIYICAWERRTGPALPVYGLGRKKDVPRPLPKSLTRSIR